MTEHVFFIIKTVEIFLVFKGKKGKSMEVCNVSLTALAMHYITCDSGNDFNKKADLKKMLRSLLPLFNACGLKMKPLYSIT